MAVFETIPLDAVTVKVAFINATVGVPLITPVVAFMLSPVGNAGLIVKLVGVSPVAPSVGVAVKAVLVTNE